MSANKWKIFTSSFEWRCLPWYVVGMYLSQLNQLGRNLLLLDNRYKGRISAFKLESKAVISASNYSRKTVVTSGTESCSCWKLIGSFSYSRLWLIAVCYWWRQCRVLVLHSLAAYFAWYSNRTPSLLKLFIFCWLGILILNRWPLEIFTGNFHRRTSARYYIEGTILHLFCIGILYWRW